ncbi:MAG: hypothetical protein N2578_03660 [Bdellovibrionaceae bacterium]|nr:hypothetical protein [Pseudobdellovibrionaceae bacterium]
MREFVVRETSERKFHFVGFGISVGGADGTEPFVVVKNKSGRTIAVTAPTSARELGVAEFPLDEYTKDLITVRDVFVWRGTQIVAQGPLGNPA